MAEEADDIPGSIKGNIARRLREVMPRWRLPSIPSPSCSEEPRPGCSVFASDCCLCALVTLCDNKGQAFVP